MNDRHKAWLASKPGLTQLDDPAFNAEAAPHLLDAPLTEEAGFFVRNNGLAPDEASLDPAAWRLTVDGCVRAPLEFSIADLRERFETVTITSVLECAGNGRSLFAPRADGLQWGLGAVACARWTGVRMADVLAAAGLAPEAAYVAHVSPDVMADGSGRPALSRGLPLAKALSPETLLCFAMNGEPLAALHGAPLRVVAPGYPGSAWQKWLNRLWVRDREHDGEKMTGTNYRLPGRRIEPGENLSAVDFNVITDMPPRAMITSPAPGFSAAAGTPFELRGFAWSGHVPVAEVHVSIDGGASWAEAALEPAGAGIAERFAWRRFSASVRAAPGRVILAARAVDVEGRTQPLDQAPWNPRGYCNNVVHRVPGDIAPA